MPMIRLQLSCGCAVVAAYVERVKFAQLPLSRQDEIKQGALAKHRCPQKPVPAPPTSTVPQKP